MISLRCVWGFSVWLSDENRTMLSHCSHRHGFTVALCNIWWWIWLDGRLCICFATLSFFLSIFLAPSSVPSGVHAYVRLSVVGRCWSQILICPLAQLQFWSLSWHCSSTKSKNRIKDQIKCFARDETKDTGNSSISRSFSLFFTFYLLL